MKSFTAFLIATCYFMSCIEAFCVYNYTEDNYFFVRQMPLNSGGTYASRFKHESIGPGEKQCCHYSTHDCNNTGDPNAKVAMGFQATFNGKAKQYMFTVTMPAGGWLEFHGKGAGPSQINVYNQDGSPYEYEYQHNPSDILLN